MNRASLAGLAIGVSLVIAIQCLWSALVGWAVFTVPGSVQYDIPNSSVRMKRLENEPSVLIFERGTEIARVEAKDENLDGPPAIAKNGSKIVFVLKNRKLGSRRIVKVEVPRPESRLETATMEELLSETEVKVLTGNEKSFVTNVIDISESGNRFLISIGEVRRPSKNSSEQLVVRPYFFSPQGKKLEVVTP